MVVVPRSGGVCLVLVGGAGVYFVRQVHVLVTSSCSLMSLSVLRTHQPEHVYLPELYEPLLFEPKVLY